MRALHLYFRLHRPYKLNSVAEFDKGYFGGEAEFREANRLEYQPFLALLERNAQKHKGLKISLGVSGIWLEQAKKWDPELLRRLKRLVEHEKVEILAMPFDYSLAWFYDMDEFTAQMAEFQTQARLLLGAECRVVAMPELIYHDKLGAWAEMAGFTGMLAGAAESILDYRSPNRVYEAATGQEASERLKLLFQNTRFSRAIWEMTDLATAERPRAKEDFGEENATGKGLEKTLLTGVNGGGAALRRHKTTAAEFVQGMALRTQAGAVKRTAVPLLEVENERVFSALKFQKELELECLRGDLVNIALGTEIFRQWRDAGIVRFFDELFASWLNNTSHRLVNATEALGWGSIGPEVSVTATIDWRGTVDEKKLSTERVAEKGQKNHDSVASETKHAGLARLAEVRYCPPERLSEPAQIKLEKSLYALKDDVLKTKDQELYRIFGRLTDLSYLMTLQTESAKEDGVAAKATRSAAHESEARAAEKANADDWYNDGARSYAERVDAVWQSFAEQVAQKLPQPAKLAAKADGKAAPVAEDEDFAVKVRRIPGKKTASAKKTTEMTRGTATRMASGGAVAGAATHDVAVEKVAKTGLRTKAGPTANGVAVKSAAVRKIVVEEAQDWGDVVWGDDWGELTDETEDLASEMETLTEEVEALARQLTRKKEAMEQNLTELAEAEVVSVAKKSESKAASTTLTDKKKRTRKKLVIE